MSMKKLIVPEHIIADIGKAIIEAKHKVDRAVKNFGHTRQLSILRTKLDEAYLWAEYYESEDKYLPEKTTVYC